MSTTVASNWTISVNVSRNQPHVVFDSDTTKPDRWIVKDGKCDHLRCSNISLVDISTDSHELYYLTVTLVNVSEQDSGIYVVYSVDESDTVERLRLIVLEHGQSFDIIAALFPI